MNIFTQSEARVLKKALRVMTEKAAVYGEVMGHPSSVKQYLTMAFAGLEREEFHVLYLTTQHQLISKVVEFIGTIDQSSVYPREIVKRALELNAAAVIFAHNHPSGVPEPSTADQRITCRLRDALALIDVRVLDHIVVGGLETVSMSERGLL